jgi:hypothetical protein
MIVLHGAGKGLGRASCSARKIASQSWAITVELRMFTDFEFWMVRVPIPVVRRVELEAGVMTLHLLGERLDVGHHASFRV